MRKTIMATGAAVLALSLSACGGNSGAAGPSTSSKTLTLAMTVAAASWDLAKTADGYNVQQYQPVYDTLLRLDPQGNVGANLAKTWKYDAGQKNLTLTLRTGQKFTDGTSEDADAVKASLLRSRNGTGEGASELRFVSDVTVVDPATIRIQLSSPDPSLLVDLSQQGGMIASPKALDNPNLPIGAGPYKIDPAATTAGRQYTYVRNNNYWNKQAFPYDTIVIKPLTDPTAAFNALMSGQVDATGISPQREAAAKSAGLTVASTASGEVEGLYIFDRAGTIVPALGNVKVRQALNYAFDKAGIITTAKSGLGTATTQVFPPGTSAYSAALNNTYSYNPTKAKELLAEAGYPNGFSVTIPDLSAQFPQLQAAMDQELANIGVKVKLVTLPLAQIFSELQAGKFAMSYFKLSALTPWDTIQMQVAPGAPWNPLKSSDPAVTALIGKIQNSTGAAQTAYYQQLNTYMVDNAWNAPWDNIESLYATKNTVAVTPQSLSAIPPIYNYKPAN